MCGQVLTHKHRTPPGVVIETKLEGDRTNKVDKTKGEGAHILREGNKAMREGDTAKCENEKLTNNKGNAMEKGEKEGSKIEKESNMEGDKIKGEGSSGDNLTERDATREGDEAKSENKGAGNNPMDNCQSIIHVSTPTKHSDLIKND